MGDCCGVVAGGLVKWIAHAKQEEVVVVDEILGYEYEVVGAVAAVREDWGVDDDGVHHENDNA